MTKAHMKRKSLLIKDNVYSNKEKVFRIGFFLAVLALTMHKPQQVTLLSTLKFICLFEAIVMVSCCRRHPATMRFIVFVAVVVDVVVVDVVVDVVDVVVNVVVDVVVVVAVVVVAAAAVAVVGAAIVSFPFGCSA